MHALCSLALGRDPQRVVELLMLVIGQDMVHLPVDARGNSLLHWAARVRAPHIVWKWLAKVRLHWRTPNRLGRTPLHVACLRRHPETIRALLQGPAPEAPDLGTPISVPSWLHVRDIRNRTSLQLLFAHHRSSAPSPAPSPDSKMPPVGLTLGAAETCAELLLHAHYYLGASARLDVARELNEPLSTRGETVMHRAAAQGASLALLGLLMDCGALWSIGTTGTAGPGEAAIDSMLANASVPLLPALAKEAARRLDRLTIVEAQLHAALDDARSRLAQLEGRLAAVEARPASLMNGPIADDGNIHRRPRYLPDHDDALNPLAELFFASNLAAHPHAGAGCDGMLASRG
jgi:hypothetical protein